MTQYSHSEIRHTIERLNYYTKLYDEGHPEITDKEWDDLYFRLQEAEQETGIYYPDSPTHAIIYQVVNNLEKVEHNHQMLSLAKTKDIEEVRSFFDDKDFIASAKLDGLTCSLRYLDGKLISAETRGNGTIGENIYHNALVIPSIPKVINYKNELVVDGEIICTYENFEPFSNQYKNPRNFASGSIRLLDSAECAKRNLTFVAWDVIKGLDDIYDEKNVFYLGFYGFKTIQYESSICIKVVNKIFDESLDPVEECIRRTKEWASNKGYPIDGVVFRFADKDYGNSLGATSHHFRHSIAYKFYDEEFETRLKNIEYTMGRTGILTPVAIFDPVDDGDSIIERASLHNLNIMKEILGENAYENQKIWVCKQNMIIPQITRAEKELPISYWQDKIMIFFPPKTCPICGKPTAINDSVQLYCTNPNCEGKWLNKIDHFCSKKGLDIKGLSKTTLAKLIDKGWINSFADIFLLENHQDEWKKMEGFGEKSVQNILSSIKAVAEKAYFAPFISAIGIPLVGQTLAKELEKNGIDTYENFRDKVDEKFDFMEFDGFGPEIKKAILSHDYKMADEVAELLNFCSVDKSKTELVESKLNNLTIVVTGRLEKFKNREEIKEFIERNGGKMGTSVSSKTACLINNNVNSTSSKNISAKKFNIPIYTETEFIEHYSLTF